MKELQKLKKEIKATLKVEKENALHYASSISEADDIHIGWIEALEYCIRQIELLEENKKLFTKDSKQIHQLSKKFHNKYISEEK